MEAELLAGERMSKAEKRSVQLELSRCSAASVEAVSNDGKAQSVL